MKKVIQIVLSLAALIALVACAGANSSSPVGINCPPNVAWQDKNPACTGGG